MRLGMREMRDWRKLWYRINWEAAMKHVIDNQDLPETSRLRHFLRIERQSRDALLDAATRHPQPRTDGNARLVAFCRIARGRLA